MHGHNWAMQFWLNRYNNLQEAVGMQERDAPVVKTDEMTSASRCRHLTFLEVNVFATQVTVRMIVESIEDPRAACASNGSTPASKMQSSLVAETSTEQSYFCIPECYLQQIWSWRDSSRSGPFELSSGERLSLHRSTKDICWSRGFVRHTLRTWGAVANTVNCRPPHRRRNWESQSSRAPRLQCLNVWIHLSRLVA